MSNNMLSENKEWQANKRFAAIDFYVQLGLDKQKTVHVLCCKVDGENQMHSLAVEIEGLVNEFDKTGYRYIVRVHPMNDVIFRPSTKFEAFAGKILVARGTMVP